MKSTTASTTALLALAALVLSPLGVAPVLAEPAGAPLGGLLPAELHDAKGNPVDVSTLAGKHVGLYFSAHWCPPCRAFTPSLVKFRDANAEDDFEIVFVSLDNSESEKKTYIREMRMKWLSVPGARSQDANALAQRFGIRGIPALVILAPDGTVVTTEGRSDVTSSPKEALAKWKEKKSS